MTLRAFYIIVVKQQAISFMPCLKRIAFCILIHIIIISIGNTAFSFYPSQEEADQYVSFAEASEAKGDFIQASDYWFKFVETAAPENPGLSRGRQRLERIGEIIPSVKQRFLKQESARLSGETMRFKQKSPSVVSLKEPAQSCIERAKAFSKNKDYVNALKALLEAKQSDPGNEELDKLLQSAMARLFP